MISRRIIPGVLHNFIGYFTIRYSDFGVYYSLGDEVWFWAGYSLAHGPDYENVLQVIQAAKDVFKSAGVSHKTVGIEI